MCVGTLGPEQQKAKVPGNLRTRHIKCSSEIRYQVFSLLFRTVSDRYWVGGAWERSLVYAATYHIYIPYSRLFWRALKLANWSKNVIGEF